MSGPVTVLAKPVAGILFAAVIVLHGHTGWASEADATHAAARLGRWIPQDAGLVVKLSRPVPQARAFLKSEQGRRLLAFPPISAWVGEARQAYQRASSHVAQELGLPLDEVVESFFARNSIFALWPPPEGQSESAVLAVIEIVDPAIANRVLSSLRDLHKKRGATPTELEWTVGGETYHVVQLPGEHGETTFACVHGDLAWISNREALLKASLGLPTNRGSLADLPAYVAAQNGESSHCVAAAFFHPRPWDAAVAKELARDTTQPPQVQQGLTATWQALDSISLDLVAAQRLTLRGRFGYRADGLPAPVGLVLKGLYGTADMVRAAPDNALVVVAGELSPGPVLQWFRQRRAATSEGAPVTLAWSGLEALLSSVGPGCVGWIVPRVALPILAVERTIAADAMGSSEFPFAWAFGLQTQALPNGNENEAPHLADSLFQLARGALELAVAARNTEVGRVVLTTVTKDDPADRSVEVRALISGKAVTRLVVAVREGRLWLGSDSSVIDAQDQKPAGSLVQSILAETARDELPGWLARVDLHAIRRWLAETPAIKDWLSKRKGLDAATAEKSWQELLALLTVCDVATAEVRSEDGVLSAALIIAAQPGPDAVGRGQ